MKRVILATITVGLAVLASTASAAFIPFPFQLPLREWADWDQPDRILYVSGYMAGLRAAEHCLGQPAEVAKGVFLGPAQIAEAVYTRHGQILDRWAKSDTSDEGNRVTEMTTKLLNSPVDMYIRSALEQSDTLQGRSERCPAHKDPADED
jgi:hypothetical protein